MREHLGKRLGHDVGEFVLLDAVPYAEQECPSRAQHTPHFGECGRLVRKKHGAELADDEVEHFIAERQLHRVRLAPFDSARRADSGSLCEHRLVQVSGDDLHVGRESLRQLASYHACACCDLEHR